MTYKFIFAILSCSNLAEENHYYKSNDKYALLKKWNKLYFDLFKEDIKFFYIELNETIETDILVEEDTIYIKGNELPLVPNMLLKTKKAIDYIHSNYDYEYIINTNLSSLWNIPRLLSLYNEIPRNHFFGGHVMFNSFITGTGIIISRDLIPIFLNINVYNYSDNNDVTISHYMINNNIPIYHLEHLPNYKIDWQILFGTCTDVTSPHHINNITVIDENTDTNNILYFRIRNESIEQDLSITKTILTRLYNINYFPEK
jgi:hypothetical protein